MLSVPYERIVQWTAGPIAILAGWGGDQLVAHVGVFSALGIQKAAVAKAIVASVTFAVGAGVTYAAHHKWLDNLSKFWNVLPKPAVMALASGIPAETPDDIISGIDAANTAAEVIQARPGTPANEIKAGLAPTETPSPAGAAG